LVKLKYRNMKNFLMIFSFLFILNSCGTDQGEGETYIYTLINSSGHNIKIEAFNLTSREEVSKITYLENGEEITKKFTSPAPPMQEYYSYVGFFEGDSIIITYDNEKRKVFVLETCEGDSRNPINICLYSNLIETFTFSEEDFENAAPCDGDCN